MKPITTYVVMLISAALLSVQSNAQPCATLVINSSNAVAASCPSGGSITISASGTGLTYRLISGPVNFPTASNTTGVFGSLAAGSYVAEIADACNNKSTVSLTIANTYTAFSVTNVSSSNVCSSGVQGGSITGTVSGGKPPYQYDIVPIAGTPAYAANTASTAYNETVTTFGIFRFYAKDACGEVRTYDINIEQTQPVPAHLWWEEFVQDRPCGETIDGMGTVTWKLHLRDQNNTGIHFTDLIGSTWAIYKPNPVNSITQNYENGDCTISQGALLSSGSVNPAGIPAGEDYSYTITIPKEDVILVFTNTCGQVFKYCYNFNEGNPVTPNVIYDVVQYGCTGNWNTQDISVINRGASYLKAPINYVLTKNGGASETNTDGHFYGLIPADFPAIITATDACGRIVSKTVTTPVQGTALEATAEPEWNYLCTNTRNTATAVIRITGGDMPGLGESVNITITGGTVTAVPTVSPYYSWVPGFYASNLLAGYTYKINITNLCGEKDSVLFTVPADHWGQEVLNWNLTATVNALCGQNKSTITANANFSGTNYLTYNLYNLTSPNTVVASNPTGIFLDVVPGNYKVKFILAGDPGLCPDKVIADSINVSVIGDGTSQSITRKTVTHCEDAGGNALLTGKAIVEVNGSAPFTYEIIKTSLIGTGASEIWTLSSSNNPDNNYTWNIPVSGDPSTTIYTLRSTDKCGNKITTQASLQPINPPSMQTSLNPCLGHQDYTISLTPYGGNFTYNWVKLTAPATSLGTQPSLTFPGYYSEANNGTYRCYATLSGCLERHIDVTLSTVLCGFTLPAKLVSFSGHYANNTATIKWISENENNLSYYDVERSTNGSAFERVSTVYARNLNSVSNYNLSDNLSTINVPYVYYRLKMTDRDGKPTYSQVIRIVTEKGNETFMLYPNPVRDYANIFISAGSNTTALVTVYDKTGRSVLKETRTLIKGSNSLNITSVQSLPAGSYIIEVNAENKKERNKFIKL